MAIGRNGARKGRSRKYTSYSVKATPMWCGLGGTEPRSHSDRPEDIQSDFGKLLGGAKVTVEYYHPTNPNKPGEQRVDQVKKYEKPDK
jgi:hypothetical protein